MAGLQLVSLLKVPRTHLLLKPREPLVMLLGRVRELHDDVAQPERKFPVLAQVVHGHVLDPRSGEPLTRRREALVVAPSATLAEALSKALLVLGEVEGVDLVAAQPDCEGLLLDADGRRFATPGWQEASGFESLTGS